MLESQEVVAVGEVEKPGADAVEANFGASRQEVSADGRRAEALVVPWLRSA